MKRLQVLISNISKFVTCTSEYIFSDLTLSLFQGVQGTMEMTTMEMETIIEKASDLLISDIFYIPIHTLSQNSVKCMLFYDTLLSFICELF